MKLFNSKSANLDERLNIIQNEHDEVITLLKDKSENSNVLSNQDNLKDLLVYLEELEIKAKDNLQKLNSNRKKNTELGRNIISNQLKMIQKLKNNSVHSDDVPVLIHDLNTFHDKLAYNLKKMSNINYHHSGITFTGIFLSFVPYYNLLSIALGGYLIYSSDYRGKVSGVIIIILTLFMLLTTRLLLMM